MLGELGYPTRPTFYNYGSYYRPGLHIPFQSNLEKYAQVVRNYTKNVQYYTDSYPYANKSGNGVVRNHEADLEKSFSEGGLGK